MNLKLISVNVNLCISDILGDLGLYRAGYVIDQKIVYRYVVYKPHCLVCI